MKNSNNISDTLTFSTVSEDINDGNNGYGGKTSAPTQEDDFVRKLSEISLRSTIMAEKRRAEYNSQTAVLPRMTETQTLPRMSETQTLPRMTETQTLPRMSETQTMPRMSETQALPPLKSHDVPAELEGMYESLATLSRIVEETADPSYGTRINPEETLADVSAAGGGLSRAKAAAAAGALYRLFLDTEDSDRICEYFFSVSHYVAAEFFRLYFENLPRGLRTALRDSLFAYTEIALDSGLQRELDLYFPAYPASLCEVSDTARTVFGAADTGVLKDEMAARAAEFEAQLAELREQNAQFQKNERQLRRTVKETQIQAQNESKTAKSEREKLEKERQGHDSTREKLEKERERREKAEARYLQIKEMMVDADMSGKSDLLTLKTDIASGLSAIAKDYAANKNAACNPTNYKAILNSLEQVFRVLKRFGIVFDTDKPTKKTKRRIVTDIPAKNGAAEFADIAAQFEKGTDSIRIDDL